MDKDIIEYHLTGVTSDGRRYKRIYSASWYFPSMGTNDLYRGSVWSVDSNGKRKLLKRVLIK